MERSERYQGYTPALWRLAANGTLHSLSIGRS
jgi:hypothetical protein